MGSHEESPAGFYILADSSARNDGCVAVAKDGLGKNHSPGRTIRQAAVNWRMVIRVIIDNMAVIKQGLSGGISLIKD
jgi:hypothetical protein